jgi:hypothetical protein
LRERRPDDIARQILKAFFVVRPNGVTAINIKTTVPPIEHIFDHRVIYFTFGLEHLENFIAKWLFKVAGFGGKTAHESAIVVKAPVSGQNV